MNLSSVWTENILHAVQAAALVVGGVWALIQWHAARQQRKSEHAWNRAKLAWNLTDRIHEAPDILPALLLLDHETDTITVGDEIHSVADADIAKALEVTSRGEFPDNSRKGRAIRTSFDALLYGLERLEHAIQLGLITRQEGFAPTKYYARLMAGKTLYEKYADHVGYRNAWKLISSL